MGVVGDADHILLVDLEAGRAMRLSGNNHSGSYDSERIMSLGVDFHNQLQKARHGRTVDEERRRQVL